MNFLNKISKPVVKYELIREAIEKKSIKPEVQLKKEETSVFTDEDFKSFEKSYFGK